MGDFDPVVAAPLTDAGLTTYTAIKPALPSLVPGTTAVVIGVGGLGLLAVQFLRTLCSARVIAVDSDATHLQLAQHHGADNTLPSDGSTAEQIRSLTSGTGANFILDCVGAAATLTTGVAGLARLGRLTLVGAALKTVPFGLHEVPWGAQLATSMNGGTVNLREVIDLARLGRIEIVEDRYPPVIPHGWTFKVPYTDRMYCVVVMLHYLLELIAPESTWRQGLIGLLDEHPNVSVSAMGFPTDWRSVTVPTENSISAKKGKVKVAAESS
jgi:hypothetical protein